MRICYTDEEILAGLRAKKSSCISFLYEEFAPALRHLVRNNSGNRQDLEDLLQDAIMVLYERSHDETFRLECSLKTYFIAVSKNLWYQRLERKYRLLYKAGFDDEGESSGLVSDEKELLEENMERQRLFYKYFMMLPNDCRRLLHLYCLKIPYRQIARMMKYKDDVYVKTRKYSCKQLLRSRILKDPDCLKLFDYGKKKD